MGHVIYINDCFFSLGDMMEYEKYGYTTDEIFDHYYKMLDIASGHNKEDSKMNIRTYKKLVL